MLDQADRLFAGVVTAERLAAADRGEWPAAIWDAVRAGGVAARAGARGPRWSGPAPGRCLALVRRAGYHTVAPAAGGNDDRGRSLGASLGPRGVGDADPGADIAAGCAAHRAPRRWLCCGGQRESCAWGARADHVLVHARASDGSGHLALVSRRAPPGDAAPQPRQRAARDADLRWLARFLRTLYVQRRRCARTGCWRSAR